MANSRLWIPAALALGGSLLGLTFAANSTFDYAAHLDRAVHDMHCSIVPGAPVTSNAEACRAAMYSPYAAVLPRLIWGGIPISLFALGAFPFYAAFAGYFLYARGAASRFSRIFFAWVSLAPLLVSLFLLTISLTVLGALCKTCAGIYVSSALLAAGGLGVGWSAREGSPGPRGSGAWVWALLLLSVLGASSLVPAVTYAATGPDHRPYLDKCGSLPSLPEAKHGLLSIAGPRPVRPALFFEDPLCPTCRAFHTRLEVEGVLDRLDAQVVLFPLDSECNWMLGEPLHPGACLVSQALLCVDKPAAALAWVFQQQDELAQAGKEGPKQLERMLVERFGESMRACMHSTKTKTRLNKHLHFAAENNVPLSTPQMYLGATRICDEDTDMGLSYTLGQLAPELLQ